MQAPTRTADQRAFCNRNLRLDQIEVVGFDMDYTLAIYDQPAMDALSIDATVRNLIAWGYPPELGDLDHRADFAIRGLVVDRLLGNILKIDRYRYVKKAYHGLTELTRDERLAEYESRQLPPGVDRYRWIDTLYELSEVAVYAAVIDRLEQLDRPVDYPGLFADVRRGIDTAHQNGDIFRALQGDLGGFLRPDPDLGPTLHRLRSSGKRLFLLTNSHWPATDLLMSYLLDDSLDEYPSWRAYFDIVITAAGKPDFFTGSRPFLAIDPTDPDARAGSSVSELHRGGVYAEGNIAELDRFLGVPGDSVLYVGDHIYGDVLRAKREPGWRTAMIIQELPDELAAQTEHRTVLDRIEELESLRRSQLDELRYWRSVDVAAMIADDGDLPAPDKPVSRAEGRRQRGEPYPERLTDPATIDAWRRSRVDDLAASVRALEAELDRMEEAVDTAFHHFWGPLFRAGSEVSSFGAQVLQYACLYTSKVSNLGSYSPVLYFRSPRQRLPHDEPAGSGI